MEWMRLLKDTPVPTILILAGIFFLLLAVAGGIAGKINVMPGRQRTSLAIGVILLLMGIIIYLVPAPSRTPTPTPAPTPTSTAAPTTGPSQSASPGVVPPKTSEGHLDLLSTARNWPTVEKDAFNGSETNWCLGEGVTVGPVLLTRRINDGIYRWQMRFDAPYVVFCAPPGGESLNDFYAAVDAKLVRGPSNNVHYGLQLRVVGNPGDNYYVFMITDNQYWQFGRYLGKEWKVWGWLPAKGIHAGEYNRLEVVADGARFHFYINGEPAGYIDDNAIPLGRTGLFVESTATTEVVVDFDNFELRKKPEPL